MYNQGRNGRFGDLVVLKRSQSSKDPQTLIPDDARYTAGEFTPKSVIQQEKNRVLPMTVLVASFLLLAVYVGLNTASIFSVSAQDAIASTAYSVSVKVDTASSSRELEYGTQPLLSQPNFFIQAKQGFIEEGAPFIEADLSEMKIRYYEEGELKYETNILSKGKEGSWWETPAGLYKIELKKENHFSSFGQVYQPWSMVFQGNFFIHGWPEYSDGSPVPEGYSGGCIRLSTETAAELYELVDVDTPVLVFEEDFASDGFEYEPKAPDVSTDHYLVIDVDSNTILAGDNIHDPVPIASLTKLMTALVAAEYINLDTTVRISQEKYVTTLIPRLEGRYKVSMYSLLQLLLVESSNEAAEVIASVIGRDDFIAKMNKKAESLGLNDTVFTDPSGLDDGNVSTATDLANLLQYIHKNRSFILELTKDADLETAYTKGEFGELLNFNDMDGVANFIGGKVGETLAAGQTSATLHTVYVDGEKRTVSIILLNTSDRTADVKVLHKYLQERFAGN